MFVGEVLGREEEARLDRPHQLPLQGYLAHEKQRPPRTLQHTAGPRRPLRVAAPPVLVSVIRLEVYYSR